MIVTILMINPASVKKMLYLFRYGRKQFANMLKVKAIISTAIYSKSRCHGFGS